MSNEPTPVLYCFRDNIPVRWEHASCLHPSSYCAYREFCPIFHKQRGAAPPSDEDPWPPRRRMPEADSSACA